jgi:ribosome biogenesis protein Tsr3
MRSPVLEDQAAREGRCLLVAQKKEEKDAAKKRQVRKALEQEALKKRRRQQSLDGLLLEESPSETVSREDETAAMMTPGHGTIPQLLWRTSPLCGPC